MAQHASGSTVTCIALDDGLVFVDAGLNTEAAAAFRAQMERRFERPTTRLILTHGHIDHIFGMGAFADVGVVAAAVERPLIEQQLAIEWNADSIPVYEGIFPGFAEAQRSARPFLPTDWVEDEQSFGPPGRDLLFATSGGHTTGSAFVWFAAERVLVSGDLVQVDKHPYFGDPTNDLAAWIAALKRWHTMEPAKICPGHGRVVDKDYIRLEWEYFESLLTALARLKAEGVPLEEAVAHPSLPAGYWDPGLPEPRWWRYCLARCYQELG
jgi:glyoxylase-like metal-dependent hydrolase (beta-lactamase superfamily II)